MVLNASVTVSPFLSSAMGQSSHIWRTDPVPWEDICNPCSICWAVAFQLDLSTKFCRYIPFVITRRRVKLRFMGLCNSSANFFCQLIPDGFSSLNWVQFYPKHSRWLFSIIQGFWVPLNRNIFPFQLPFYPSKEAHDVQTDRQWFLQRCQINRPLLERAQLVSFLYKFELFYSTFSASAPKHKSTVFGCFKTLKFYTFCMFLLFNPIRFQHSYIYNMLYKNGLGPGPGCIKPALKCPLK